MFPEDLSSIRLTIRIQILWTRLVQFSRPILHRLIFSIQFMTALFQWCPIKVQLPRIQKLKNRVNREIQFWDPKTNQLSKLRPNPGVHHQPNPKLNLGLSLTLNLIVNPILIRTITLSLWHNFQVNLKFSVNLTQTLTLNVTLNLILNLTQNLTLILNQTLSLLSKPQLHP